LHAGSIRKVLPIFSPKFAKKQLSLDEVRDMLDVVDDEDIDCDNYGHESNFESECEPDEAGSDDGADSDNDNGNVPVQNVLLGAVSRSQQRGRGRRGANTRRAAPAPVYLWIDDNTGFTDDDFRSSKVPGPQNIPNNLKANDKSTPLEWFSLLWPPELWQPLVDETSNQAARVRAAAFM
jgi:hypothetical protein